MFSILAVVTLVYVPDNSLAAGKDRRNNAINNTLCPEGGMVAKCQNKTPDLVADTPNLRPGRA